MFKALGLPDYDQTSIHVRKKHTVVCFVCVDLFKSQVIGTEASYGAKRRGVSPREVMLWLAVKHQSKRALELFSREIAPAGTGMAPGFTNMAGGRPRVYVPFALSCINFIDLFFECQGHQC